MNEAEKKFGNVEIEQLEKENRFSLKFETKDSLRIESLDFLKQNFKNSNFGKIGEKNIVCNLQLFVFLRIILLSLVIR